MWYGGRGIEYTERQMHWKLHKLKFQIWRKGGIDIVLTHAPPKGIHDGKDVCHTGFSSFRKLIEKYKPRYFIHGHTHVSYGYSREKITQFQGTKVINVDGYHILEIESLKEDKKRTREEKQIK
jgi:Icc-related predicted phosphoesterase